MGKQSQATAEIITETVDNPYLTDAMRADGTGERYIKVEVNQRTRLGGFFRFKGDMAQKRVAARFKDLSEQAMLGGPRAMDTEQEPVDGGGINPEMNHILGMEARARLDEARDVVGRKDFDRFTLIVIGGMGPTGYARYRSGEYKPSGRTVTLYAQEIFIIADRLAEFWGYRT